MGTTSSTTNKKTASNYVLSREDALIRQVTRVSKYMLAFVKEVDKFPCLYYSVPLMKRAIHRYETMWLPLLKTVADPVERVHLVPPLDVEWAWHCHMLSPIAYRDDLTTVLGEVMDHKLRSWEKRKEGKKQAMK